MISFSYNSRYVIHYVLATIYLTSIISTALMVPFISGASPPYRTTDEWKLTFYTGDKIWAGTDSLVYVQVHGTNIDSQIYQLNPEKYQMEAQAVDSYLISLPRNLGTIKSITVGKQHSYSFFNDWQLIKVELTDPNGKKYIFNCNCWLTTLRFKRTIELSSIDGVDQDSNSNLDPFNLSSGKTTRVFPMTIGLLFLLLILIIFTYFGNVMCKKWKENILFRGTSQRHSRHHRTTNSSGSNRGIYHRAAANTSNQTSRTRNDLYKDDDDEENAELAQGVYNITNNLNNLNVNSTQRSNLIDQARNSHSLVSEDKPPDYTQLFPMKTINETSHEENININNNSNKNDSNLTSI